MKKLLIISIFSVTFLVADLVKGEPFKNFELENQFDQKVSVSKSIKKVIFAFKKDTGHMVRGFLNTQKDDYLLKKDILFVADVSAMPKIIRWFVLDELDKNPYSIILIEDEDISKTYKPKENLEKVMVVSLDNMIVQSIDYFDDIEKLKQFLD